MRPTTLNGVGTSLATIFTPPCCRFPMGPATPWHVNWCSRWRRTVIAVTKNLFRTTSKKLEFKTNPTTNKPTNNGRRNNTINSTSSSSRRKCTMKPTTTTPTPFPAAIAWTKRECQRPTQRPRTATWSVWKRI